MLNDQRPPPPQQPPPPPPPPPSSRLAGRELDPDDIPEVEVREVHPQPSSSSSSSTGRGRRPSWEVSSGSHRSSSLSVSSSDTADTLPSMSREFSAMVVAGSSMQRGDTGSNSGSSNSNSGGGSGSNNHMGDANLGMIGEGEELEETNPLAIVPDTNPIPSPRRAGAPAAAALGPASAGEEVSVHRVKKEEVESKISAWQTAEIAQINNRFKRQDVVINGWESEQVEKATTWLKKVERKLDEERARAVEKMQNDIAKARRKAEEKRASAEAKRGTKVARILELSNLLRAVGRAPSKRSFF